jgi:hypothetical protein
MSVGCNTSPSLDAFHVSSGTRGVPLLAPFHHVLERVDVGHEPCVFISSLVGYQVWPIFVFYFYLLFVFLFSFLFIIEKVVI